MRRRCHWVSPSRRGDKRTPLGALRRSWGHREQLEDFPGEVGAPRHRVTPQSWGRPHSVTPQSWGHPCSFTPRSWKNPHSVTPQSWGHLCVTPMVSDPKAGDTPQCHTPKLGTPRQCHISKLGQLCVPPMVSDPKVGDAPTVSQPKVGVRPRGGSAPTSPPWRHIPKLGTPSGDPFSASPIADRTVPMGWGRGAPFIFGIKVYFVIKGCWGIPPPRE